VLGTPQLKLSIGLYEGVMRCKDRWHGELVLTFQRLAGKPPKGRRWNRAWRRRLLSSFEYHTEVAARVMAAEMERVENDRILNDLINMAKAHWDDTHAVPYDSETAENLYLNYDYQID